MKTRKRRRKNTRARLSISWNENVLLAKKAVFRWNAISSSTITYHAHKFQFQLRNIVRHLAKNALPNLCITYKIYNSHSAQTVVAFMQKDTPKYLQNDCIAKCRIIKDVYQYSLVHVIVCVFLEQTEHFVCLDMEYLGLANIEMGWHRMFVSMEKVCKDFRLFQIHILK